MENKKKDKKIKKIKCKHPFVDVQEVNDIPITDVAEMLGYSIKKRTTKGGFIECPFHNDRHPDNCSLLYSPSTNKNLFKCFRCGEKGNVIQFIMKVKNCNFSEGLIWAAKNFNLKIINEIEVEEEEEQEKKNKPKLNYAEYSYFNLKNSFENECKEYNTSYVENKFQDNSIYKKKSYSLYDLYIEEPELHDEILCNKFCEKIIHCFSAYSLVCNKSLKDIDVITTYEEEIKNNIKESILKTQELFYKGLYNKSLYNNFMLKDLEKIS